MSIGEEIERAYSELHQWIFQGGETLSFAEKRDTHPYPASLSASQVDSFTSYLNLLSLWTKRIDLVAPATEEVLIQRHLLDSWAAGMVLAQVAPIDPAMAYLDVGSGAGLPGLVFAVFEPERQIYLCEPREKRVTFMQNAISSLQLSRVTPLCQRAEQLQALTPAPGLLTARALGKTELLFETALRIGAEDCVVTELLGPSWRTEETEQAAESAGCEALLRELVPYSLLSEGPQRQLAVWNVSRETSKSHTPSEA